MFGQRVFGGGGGAKERNKQKKGEIREVRFRKVTCHLKTKSAVFLFLKKLV